MTNYNERLYEVLERYRLDADMAYSEVEDGFHTADEFKDVALPKALNEAKQAITSLIKELVEEAKPEKQFDLGQVVYVEDTGGRRAIGRWVGDQQQFQIKNGTGSDYMDGYNAAIDQFEQNLLKALESK